MDKKLINDINYTNFAQFINSGLVLLDFWAPWCTACKTQDKIYKELADMFSKNLTIGKIDVADNRFLADKFGVRNIPHIILLKDGEKLFQMSGIENKEYLISQIKKHII